MEYHKSCRLRQILCIDDILQVFIHRGKGWKMFHSPKEWWMWASVLAFMMNRKIPQNVCTACFSNLWTLQPFGSYFALHDARSNRKIKTIRWTDKEYSVKLCWWPMADFNPRFLLAICCIFSFVSFRTIVKHYLYTLSFLPNEVDLIMKIHL